MFTERIRFCSVSNKHESHLTIRASRDLLVLLKRSITHTTSTLNVRSPTLGYRFKCDFDTRVQRFLQRRWRGFSSPGILSRAARQAHTISPKASPIIVESLKVNATCSFETSGYVNAATEVPDSQTRISRKGNNNLYHCVLYIAQYNNSVTTYVCLL